MRQPRRRAAGPQPQARRPARSPMPTFSTQSPPERRGQTHRGRTTRRSSGGACRNTDDPPARPTPASASGPLPLHIAREQAAVGTERWRESAMHIPRFMRRVNRTVTNPVLGTIAWALPPLAIVGHVGRKSGRRYRTPVVAFPTATGFVIPMTYGRDVDWARNLVKGRGGELVRRGHHFALRNPRIVG